MVDFSAYRTIRAAHRGRILTLTLDRATRGNAVDGVMHGELARIFLDAADDPLSDVVVLTGAGDAFCAGGDIGWMQSLIDDGFDQVAREAQRIVFGLLDCHKPVIARVNGHAVGLGATMALLCDVVFAAEGARIGDPHVRVGLTAGDGGAMIWPLLVGPARAKEYLMTGDLVSAQEAERIGLVNHAVPPGELAARVDAFADRLAGGALGAISSTKRAVNIALKQSMASLMDASLAWESAASMSADHQEAVAAFREKREPDFSKGPPARTG